MKNGKRCTAVVLAAGSGSRMHSDVPKQYMNLAGKPVLWYSLDTIQRSDVIDDCILVTGSEDLDYARREIVEKYGFSKVDRVIEGGEERYLSVGNALRTVAKRSLAEPEGYIFIHDGARPFLTEEMLERLAETVEEVHACVAATPSKDTVKIADDQAFAIQTPDRSTVWNVQTPQVFDAAVILTAYERLEARLGRLKEQGIVVTDDAGVVELFTEYKVKMVQGSYRNIKITTPEDMIVAEAFLTHAAAERTGL